MSESTTRALIKTVLENITSIGKVYDYERFNNDWGEYLELFKTTSDIIKGWTITCEGWPNATKEGFPRGSKGRPYIYKIRGYYGLNDSKKTEKTAIALAETVCDTLDEDATIHPKGTGLYGPVATLDVFEPRMFGDVLCHYTEITQIITESLSA